MKNFAIGFILASVYCFGVAVEKFQESNRHTLEKCMTKVLNIDLSLSSDPFMVFGAYVMCKDTLNNNDGDKIVKELGFGPDSN